jgi:hypothetical protein
MPLGADAMKYCDELFRSTRAALEKERDRKREQLWQGLLRIEDAEKRAGYPRVLQPEFDLVVGLGKARADAMRKAFDWDEQELTEEVIAEIVADAETVLQQSLGGLTGGEKSRMASLAQRTGQTDPTANAKIGRLTRHVSRTISDAKGDIRNELMLRMLEAKKSGNGGRATMKVRELARRIQKFHDDLAAHFELWGQSLDSTLPEYPIRNNAELSQQSSGLARQLGSLRRYLDNLGLHTVMGTDYAQWDAYDSAVSNDVAIRKGSSIDAILPQLDQALGRLELLNPDSEFDAEDQQPASVPQHVTNIYNVHGANSRVNVQSTDHSLNISTITEQQVFSGIRQAVNQGVLDDGERARILEKLNELERSIHTCSFLSQYQAFINAVASHMTIISPFLPALTQMLGS